MPFVTEYTPTEALFALAEKAGKAQGLQTGAQLALQYQQMENQRRQAETNAYLTQLAQRQQAQRAKDNMALQYAELGQRQAESEFDRVKFAKTYDLQTAIEERQRQESMTPTQQFQQKLALEEAKAKYKVDAESRKNEQFKIQEDYKQKNKIALESLKGNIGGAGGVDLAALKPELSNAFQDYKRLATLRDSLGDQLRSGVNKKGYDLTKQERAAIEENYRQVERDYEKAMTRYETASEAMTKASGVGQQASTSGLVTGGVQSGSNSPSIQPGFIRNGYRYKGGDAADPKNWEKV